MVGNNNTADRNSLVRITSDGHMYQDHWETTGGYIALAVAPNGRVIAVPNHGEDRTRVLNPDGKRYVLNSPDGTVITWASFSPTGDVLLMTAAEKIYTFPTPKKDLNPGRMQEVPVQRQF